MPTECIVTVFVERERKDGNGVVDVFRESVMTPIFLTRQDLGAIRAALYLQQNTGMTHLQAGAKVAMEKVRALEIVAQHYALA